MLVGVRPLDVMSLVFVVPCCHGERLLLLLMGHRQWCKEHLSIRDHVGRLLSEPPPASTSSQGFALVIFPDLLIANAHV